jgi:hypothetical protein
MPGVDAGARTWSELYPAVSADANAGRTRTRFIRVGEPGPDGAIVVVSMSHECGDVFPSSETGRQITSTGAAHKNDEERERANAAWFALERTQ